MDRVQMSEARLAELSARFGQCRIAVIGDFFLDKYLDVDPALAETSVETGLTAHQVVDVRCSPGAAGTIVCNLAALGAGRLEAIGFTGDDGEGFELRKELERLNCLTRHLHIVADRHTPTYLKPRDAHLASLQAEHPRYDTKNRRSTSSDVEDQILRSLRDVVEVSDAIIVMDQVEEADCGVITARVRAAISEQAQQSPQVIFWADSRRRIREFSQVIIKPNQFEAVGQCSPVPGEDVLPDELRHAAQQLRQRTGAPVVVTRGAAGMLVSDPQWTLVPGVRVAGEIDPTGAGDSATAGAVLALAAGAELPEAALIGNLVASITVQQIGTTGVARPDQLPHQLRLWRQQGD